MFVPCRRCQPIVLPSISNYGNSQCCHGTIRAILYLWLGYQTSCIDTHCMLPEKVGKESSLLDVSIADNEDMCISLQLYMYYK